MWVKIPGAAGKFQVSSNFLHQVPNNFLFLRRYLVM
jgi:hypothetical protein